MYQRIIIVFVAFSFSITQGNAAETRMEDSFGHENSSLSTLLNINSSLATSSVIKSASKKIRRGVIANKQKLWPHAVVPYEFEDIISVYEKTMIRKAMRHWEQFTCIQFVEIFSHQEHPNGVIFTKKPCGYCSHVGMARYGRQMISIGEPLQFAVIVHELGHALGFLHEQSRPDRDNYIKVIKDSIIDGMQHNFEKYSRNEIDSLGQPYDYYSIMHYRRDEFSKNYNDTLIPNDDTKRNVIGVQETISMGDIIQMNLLYNCPECGRTFQKRIGHFGSPIPHADQRCEWRITASNEAKIALLIKSLDIYESKDCMMDYIEIRDGYWPKSPLLGRFCGRKKIDKLIMSTGSRMLVTFVKKTNKEEYRGFRAKYMSINEDFLTQFKRLERI